MAKFTPCRVLITLNVFLVVCQAIFDRYGVVTPPDPFKFVGDSLTLNCNITTTDLREDSSMLRFERSSLDNKAYSIPERYIQILTSKSIRLHIPHLTINDDGNYVCYQMTYGNRNRTIGHQRVIVDYRPKRVESIDCLVYNWQNMTCSWSLGVDFKYPQYVESILTWTFDGNQSKCPKVLSITSCAWPSNEVYIQDTIYSMGVVVQTKKGDKVLEKTNSPLFRVETRLYVKPAPIQDLQAIEENSTCIRLNWKHPSPKRRKKSFLGMYEKAGSNQWEMINMSSIKIKNDFSWTSMSSEGGIYPYSMSTVVCHLTPYTSYNFNMSVLPYPEGSKDNEIHGHRSEWISVPATTREDVPGISPPLCHSCYHVDKCDHPWVDQRCVRIYWGETPVSQRHGKFRDYSIRAVNGNYTFSKTVSSDANDISFIISEEFCKVLLRSTTSIGSSMPSILTIPAKSGLVMPPKGFKVETDADQRQQLKYYLSWDRLESDLQEAANITVFWCTSGAEHYECKDNIKWTRIPKGEINFSFTPGERFRKRINIGIAMEVFVGETVVGSGISWTDCIYYRNEKPKKMPKNVRISTTQGALTVEWDKPDCMEEKAFVEEYKVSLCQTQDGTTCIAGTLDVRRVITDTKLTFKDMESENPYLVNVSAMSLMGYGPSSISINATVQPLVGSDSGMDETVIIVVVVLAIILFLIITFFIVISVRCVLNRKGSVREQLVALEKSYGESKQPLNQPSRFRDRPLPEPPSAAQHYYGLKACMTNPGSSGHGSGSPSEDSVESNQDKLLGINGSESAGGEEYHELLPKDEQESDQSSGIASDIGGSSKSDMALVHSEENRNKSQLSVYSKEKVNPFVEPYSKMTQASGSGSKGGILLEGFKTGKPIVIPEKELHVPHSNPSNYLPNGDQPTHFNVNNTHCVNGPRYETPITAFHDDVEVKNPPQQSIHEQNTLPSRKLFCYPALPGVTAVTDIHNANIGIGQLNDISLDNLTMNAKHQPQFQFNSIPNSSKPKTAITENETPKPPSSQPPPLPPRKPSLDNPPLYPAPPPPKRRSSYPKTSITSLSKNHKTQSPTACNNSRNLDNTSKTTSDCDEPHSPQGGVGRTFNFPPPPTFPPSQELSSFISQTPLDLGRRLLDDA